MTSWSYILQSLPWALAGLLTGFFMGRSTTVVEAIADAVQEGDGANEEGVAMSGSTKSLRRRIDSVHVIGAIVVVLGVFTAVQSYVQGHATERLTVCTQAYSNGFADAIEQRSKASAEAQDALDEFLSAVSAATPTQQGRDLVRDALAQYLSKRADAKKAQSENPFPAPPRDVC